MGRPETLPGMHSTDSQPVQSMPPSISTRLTLSRLPAYFQDEAAVLSISPVNLFAGTLPQKRRRLVEAWVEVHQEELIADWRLPHAGDAAVPIESQK